MITFNPLDAPNNGGFQAYEVSGVKQEFLPNVKGIVKNNSGEVSAIENIDDGTFTCVITFPPEKCITTIQIAINDLPGDGNYI